MTDHSRLFFQYLEALDLEGLRKLWAHVSPHLPQPRTDFEAQAAAHLARTGMASMPEQKRFYSHSWLRERDLPSKLPDVLRPRAERIYPIVKDAVGIAIMCSKGMKPAMLEVRGAMEDVVQNCYADKKTDPIYVKPRMMEAYRLAKKKLLGSH